MRGSTSGAAAELVQDLAGGEMGSDLALDPLQRVVDGLAVASQFLPDRHLGVAVEVQREYARLELGEHRGQARDQ